MGCHRPRVANRVIIRGLLLRLVTGSSWDTIEFMMDGAVSDTTLRARRDEWEQSDTDAANRNDFPLMFDVLDDLHTRNQLRLVGTFHADRGFNYTETPDRLANDYGLNDFRAPSRNTRTQGRKKRSPSGPRWIVEAANSWLRNNGQIANNTDRKPEHREAALCFAIAILLVHRISHPKHSTWRPTR